MRLPAYGCILIVHNVANRSGIEEIAFRVQRNHNDRSEWDVLSRRSHQFLQKNSREIVLHVSRRQITQKKLVFDVNVMMRRGNGIPPALEY